MNTFGTSPPSPLLIKERGGKEKLSTKILKRCHPIKLPLSLSRREALIPHSLVGKGARGLGFRDVEIKQTSSEIKADDTLEQSELLLSGLLARREGKLKVYNLIYKQVFNNNWVENELKNLRPYSESFKFWVASGGKDESRLLRGKALVDAEEWGKDKNFSYQDKQFLAASREKEIQEKIAADEQAAKLERERKDKEAVEKRNLVLSEANQKAKQRIRNGSVVLGLALFGTVISVTIAGQKVLEAQNKIVEAQNKLKETYKYVAYPQQLRELVRKFTPESEEAIEISKQAAIKIKDPILEQVYLHTSKSLAYQYLGDWKSAEESIKHSMNFLRGWEENQGKIADKESKSKFLQLKIFALSVKGDLLKKQKNTLEAMTAYQEALNILQNSKISSSKSELSILDKNTVESLQRRLIELLPNIKDYEQFPSLRNSLIQHFYNKLEYFLKIKNWREADITTFELMLFIANRGETDYLHTEDINRFSCSDLKKIDNYWVQNSDGRFGFSVQKKIWVETENLLGITEQKQENYDNYLKLYRNFTSNVGWNDLIPDEQKVIEVVKKNYKQAPRGILPLRYPWMSERVFAVVGTGGQGIFSRLTTCKI